MGSDLLMVVLPTPTDGPPDWAAAHVAVDGLTYDELAEEVLNRVEEEVDEEQVDNEEAVLVAATARLHGRITELQEAYGGGQEAMHQDLTFLYLFDRRMLVTGGPSFGGPPTELFNVLVELADTVPVAKALAGDDRPVPPTASTPYLDVGAVLEIDGYGLRTITAEATLVEAPTNTPISARAEIGSVIFLRRDHRADGGPLVGHGHFLIEQDCRDLEDDTAYPALTPLFQGD
jgi:hypothetical protein